MRWMTTTKAICAGRGARTNCSTIFWLNRKRKGNEMNRRDFGKQVAAAAFVSSIAGCGVSSIEGYINAIDIAVTGVLNLIGDTALAARIQKAVDAVNAAIANWKSGTIPRMVNAMGQPRQHARPNSELKTHRAFAKLWNQAVDTNGLPTTLKVKVPLF